AVKQKADYLGWETHPYNALLDEYEPQMTTTILDKVFSELLPKTKSLLSQIQGAKKNPSEPITHTYDKQKQWDFSMSLLEKIGFDFESGRLDKSTHPFTIDISPNDVRITTRLSSHNLMEGISSTLHEGGHALYEQGLNLDWANTPLCSSASLGIHESQSRLWENQIGKSRLFWDDNFEGLKTLFPEALSSVSVSEFYQDINQVKPGFIRVEADEVTYNLHIMIRYEIEKKMLTEDISITDLPDLWNSYYQDYLGITPPNASLGILQDVHWSLGSIGYFPTYTLGNLYAAMIYKAALSGIPTLHTSMNATVLKSLKEWLNKKVHQKGRLLNPQDLIKEVTGSALTDIPFLEYLTEKFC
ncbi:MAG: carboxypeptidase M32, partial [Candidatus Margulisbacteria bacterium]|nr:carboxypeptidase M32 [Candidatus Margulisiibacteriota bacterium]